MRNKLVSSSWINIYFTFSHLNRNTNNVVLNTVIFKRHPSGLITSSYDSVVSSFRYKTPVSKLILFFECICLMITAFYWYLLLKSVIIFFFEFVKEFLNKQPELMRRDKICFRVFNINSQILQENSVFKLVLHFVGKMIES